MLELRLLGFPVRIEPWFWLTAAYISGAFRGELRHTWPAVLTVMAVVLVSIVVHELGHALAVRRYGGHPSILLHLMGGLTMWPSEWPRLTRMQRIIISAAGPAAGFLLAAAVWVIAQSGWLPDNPREQGRALLGLAVSSALWINIVWTLLNLLPIQPLDGGQILRDVLGPSREGLSRGIGCLVATVGALYFASQQVWFTAVMLGILAYLNATAPRTMAGGTQPADHGFSERER